MRNVILVLVLFILFVPMSYAATMGLWTFDEPIGSIAYDSSGHGNDGTIYGVTRTTDTPFSYAGNRAMSFDGLNDYINAGSGSSLNLTSAFTLEAWIKPESVGSRYIADKSHIYVLKLEDNTQYPLAGIKNNDSYFDLFSNVEVPLNSWSHIASTYDGSVLRLYVNGVLVGENPLTSGGMKDSSINPSSDFIIGNHSLIGYPSNYYFDGLIDEVRISDVALTPEQLGYHQSFGAPISASVPEPASFSLFGLGLLGLLGKRRKR